MYPPDPVWKTLCLFFDGSRYVLHRGYSEFPSCGSSLCAAHHYDRIYVRAVCVSGFSGTASDTTLVYASESAGVLDRGLASSTAQGLSDHGFHSMYGFFRISDDDVGVYAARAALARTEQRVNGMSGIIEVCRE